VEWEDEARQEVRIEHALRHHVSIGAADRQLVTEQAATIRRWAVVSLVGWPLLLTVLVAPLLASADVPPPAKIGFGLIAGLLCAAIVREQWRRVRRARRWLAEPLPRPRPDDPPARPRYSPPPDQEPWTISARQGALLVGLVIATGAALVAAAQALL
jgi:hypothetical protein